MPRAPVGFMQRASGHMRWTRWLVSFALLLSLTLSAGSALAALVIPAGREAVVLELVRTAWTASGEHGATEYNIQIDADRVRVQLEPGDAELVVYAGDAGPGQLAPGVVLRCGTDASDCSQAERGRWAAFAARLSAGRDGARDQIWAQAASHSDALEAPRWPFVAWAPACIMLLGLGWLTIYSARVVLARPIADTPRAPRALLATALLILVFVGAALWGTAALPLHEHNSYVARNDCAWTYGCFKDPAGPAWVEAFFSAYRPLVRSISYSVVNTCRLSLALAVCAVLLARHWLTRALLHAGWSYAAVRRTALWATAFLCLNPICIRVAVSGTPWPYVLVCLFGSGVACFEALGAETRGRRFVAGVAAICLLSLAANSNFVMLTLLPLIWLGPSSCGRGAGVRSWLPTRKQTLAAAALLGLSYQSIQAFFRALSGGASTQFGGAPNHTFFDARLLPPSLGVLLLLGLVVSLGRRSPLLALVYAALITHPTLSNYGGPLLGKSYPVGFIDAYFGNVLSALIAAVGVGWLLTQASRRGVALARANLVVCLVLLAPTALAHESWAFLRGSRVLERELTQISALLPQLPEHDQLLIPSGIQPPLPGSPALQGDPIEVRFPRGEYLASQRRLGRVVPAPLPLERMDERVQGARTLVYVGVSQRSFLNLEITARLVPEDLERAELRELRRRYTLEPVLTFELSPAQHPAIPWRLGADHAARVQLGFYWLRPKSDKP